MLNSRVALLLGFSIALATSAPGVLRAADNHGSSAGRLDRTPILNPDRTPVVRIRGLKPDVHGRYLNAYYISATRISVGDGIPGMPYVREIRRVQLNLETQSGEVTLPGQSFERNSQNRVNMILLTGQDQEQTGSLWINADRSCPIGVSTCARNPDLNSFGVLTLENIQERHSADEVTVSADEFIKKRARRP